MDTVRRAVPDTARVLVAAGLTPLFARIYAARGVNDATDLEHELARLQEW